MLPSRGDQPPASLSRAQLLTRLFVLRACILLIQLWEPGGELEKAIKSLATAWRNLFTKHTNAELGLDVEYTRPGIEALLEDFVNALKRCEATHDFAKKHMKRDKLFSST